MAVTSSLAPGRVRVGCSGWSYDGWRGIAYPEGVARRDWFHLYAEAFDTVELNNTHYRLPTASAVERWAEQAPPGFCYAVKVGRYGTHRKKLKDPEAWLANHIDRIGGLGDHLGPQLLQLPPRWRRDVARLDAALAVAPPHLRWAVEVRDQSWLHDDVYACLAEHGAALCLHDLLPGHPWKLTAGWTYVRFHGPRAAEQPYRGAYGGRRLWRAADRLGAWRDDGVDVYAYFNNDVGGHAVTDARWLHDRLTSGSSRHGSVG